MISAYDNGDVLTLQAGSGSFAFTPPAGYSPVTIPTLTITNSYGSVTISGTAVTTVIATGAAGMAST